MTTMFNDFKALTFDCYGTLIDWESGIWDAFQPVLLENHRADITRQVLLEAFAKAETAQQTATPGMRYPDILARVHEKLAETFELDSNRDMAGTFGDSVPLWPAFPDSADALRRLKTRFKLVILSNVHRDGFAASKAKLGVEFDAIYTAEDVGSYKPDPRNFEYMLSHLDADLGLNGPDILHTAQSLFHDHAPADAHKLACCWIDRQDLDKGGNWGATAKVEQRPDLLCRFGTLAEMADTVGC